MTSDNLKDLVILSSGRLYRILYHCQQWCEVLLLLTGVCPYRSLIDLHTSLGLQCMVTLLSFIVQRHTFTPIGDDQLTTDHTIYDLQNGDWLALFLLAVSSSNEKIYNCYTNVCTRGVQKVLKLSYSQQIDRYIIICQRSYHTRQCAVCNDLGVFLHQYNKIVLTAPSTTLLTMTMYLVTIHLLDSLLNWNADLKKCAIHRILMLYLIPSDYRLSSNL
jgi:hypothetical protein